MEWIPGKNHTIADTLSRSPVFAAPDHKDIIIRQVTEDAALEEMSKIADLALSTGVFPMLSPANLVTLSQTDRLTDDDVNKQNF